MSMRFVILADVHLPAPGSQPNAAALADLFRRAVDRVRELNPASVILLGDTVERGVAAEYALAREIVKPIRLLVRPMPGNHELDNGTLADFRAAWAAEPFAADLMNGWPIMRFNSAIEGLVEDEYYGRIPSEQLRLLDALLAAHPASPTMIFSHHPLSGTVRRSEEFN